MHRRNFVKSLLSLIGGGLLPNVLQAKTNTKNIVNSDLFESLGVAYHPVKRSYKVNVIGVGINAGHILQDLSQFGFDNIEYTYIDSYFDGGELQTLWMEPSKGKMHLDSPIHRNEKEIVENINYKKHDYDQAHRLIDRKLKTNIDMATIIIADTSEQAARLFLPYLVKMSSKYSHTTLSLNLINRDLLRFDGNPNRYLGAINFARIVGGYSDLSMMLFSDSKREKKSNCFLNNWSCSNYGSKGYSIKSMVSIIYRLFQSEIRMPGVDIADLRSIFFGIPIKPPIEYEVNITGEFYVDKILKENYENDIFIKRAFIYIRVCEDVMSLELLESIGKSICSCLHPGCMKGVMFVKDSSEDFKGKARITILHA